MKLAPRISQVISKIFAFPWLPELLAGFAGVLYLIQSIAFAYTQWSVTDEGNYAYKGWLFVTGQYIPYQDFGPWTNHMPFSFLIFGAPQLLFGPGIRTIRYFMVFIGCLLLLGLWLASRRLGGRWAGAAALWFLALNPFPISNYSVGIAEGPVACILIWMLYFTLGEGRSLKELLTGALLATTLVLTRENMILILPFLFIYVFWQNGKKIGLIYLGIVSFLLLAVHALYWPNILRVWAAWSPIVRKLLGEWVYQGTSTNEQLSKASFAQNLFVVVSSIQVNFLAVLSPIAVWLGWPKGGFKDRAQFKTVVFLSAAFVLLFVAHASASLGKSYCAFCLVNYLTFFSPIGILLLFTFLPGIKERQPILPLWLTWAVILILATGIGYANFDRFGATIAAIPIPRKLTLPFETVEIWRVLANKFSLDFSTLRRLLPSAAGFIIGLVALIIGYILAKKGSKKLPLSNPIYLTLSIIVLAGLALSPTLILGDVAEEARCDKDILAQYEKVGAQLAQRIPSGAQIYWRGDPSPIPLLYLSGIKIYPPQLNGFFSFRSAQPGIDVTRYGFWNTPVDQKWRPKAKIVLIREREFSFLQKWLSSNRFKELEQTDPVFLCASNTQIRIFKRK